MNHCVAVVKNAIILICDQPSRRTQALQHLGSDSEPSGLGHSEQDILVSMRAFVQANPFIAELLRNPQTVAPELTAVTVPPKTGYYKSCAPTYANRYSH